MKYKIAINKMQLDSKLPPGDPRWAQLNDSFVNQEIDLTGISNAIYMGQSYTAWFSGRRKDENFLCSQFIAVDMETHDERSSLDYLTNMEFVQIYGGLVYTTPSHTATDPHARVMFFLDQPITDSAAYEVAIGFVYSLFPGSDVACVDSSRFFYGSKNCQLEWINNTLPLAHLRTFYARWGEYGKPTPQPVQQRRHTQQTQKPVATGRKLGADMFLAYAIQDATGEGRNKRGYRFARQLKELGYSQFEAEGWMRQYQQAVERTGTHNYTMAEALTNLKSAYSRPTVH